MKRLKVGLEVWKVSVTLNYSEVEDCETNLDDEEGFLLPPIDHMFVHGKVVDIIGKGGNKKIYVKWAVGGVPEEVPKEILFLSSEDASRSLDKYLCDVGMECFRVINKSL
jgi:hypothetical protein